MPVARDPFNPLRVTVLRYPALPLVAVALCTFFWFAAANGGFDGSTWYPGTLILLALVAIAAVTLPATAVPRVVAVAAVALLAYAAWSYLSIGWAAQKGDAWDGANRSLLYALSFSLFALWRPRARAAVAILVVYALGLTTVGLIELLRASSVADPRAFFIEGRFASPAGYMNANVALWFSAFWPCVALGARRELAPWLRGMLVGAAVILCGLTVLGQSRGWLFIAPVAALVFIALVPQRVRTLLTLGFVLAVTGVVTPTLLEVYKTNEGRGFPQSVADSATALVIAAVVAGLIATVAAFSDRRVPVSRERNRRAGRALAIAAVAVALLGGVTFLATVGSPFTAASKAWHEFKTKPSPYGQASRFSGSLGTNRFDFWRVAWDKFDGAPLVGIGADNFQEAYLVGRKSNEAPRYPHSIELRTLSQTGLVGAALLILAIAAGLYAAVLAIRRRSGLGSAAAAIATTSFLYWLLHGSVDWFYEFPALGAPAFALLGLAAGLMPRAVGRSRPASGAKAAPAGGRPGRSRLARLATTPAVVLAIALIPAVSLAMPWLAQLQQNAGVSTWTTDQAGAFSSLDSAAALNPLSATPRLYAGSIALRLGQRARAEGYFRDAIKRDPGDVYAHLELGALLAGAGHRPQALVLLERAKRLDPQDDLTAGVLRRVRRGQAVDIAGVNRQLAERSARVGR